eukprot:jgi/Mesvir1/16596/Mv10131-RA.1
MCGLHPYEAGDIMRKYMSRWCKRTEDLVRFTFSVVYSDNSEAVSEILNNHNDEYRYYNAVSTIPLVSIMHRAHHAFKRQLMSCALDELMARPPRAPPSLATRCYWGLSTHDMAVWRGVCAGTG